MEKRDQKIAHVQKLYDLYAAGLASVPRITVIPVKTSQGEVPNYVEILCEERDRLRQFLGERGIDSRPFLPCLHRSPHRGVRHLDR